MKALATKGTGAMTRQAIDGGLLARFIEFIDARPTTASAYTRHIRQFFGYMDRHEIAQPTRADVIAYRDELKASGHKPATVTAYVVALRQFFKWTGTEGYYPDICVNVKGEKIDTGIHKRDPLTSRQIKAVLSGIDRSTASGARDYAIIATMTTGGLRTIEVIRADVGDLRALADDTVLYIHGKGRDEKADYIKIVPEVEAAIRDYLRHRGATPGTEPLFTSESHKNAGGRLTTRSVSRLVKERFRAAGLDSERLTAHSLRHTAGTLSMINGGTVVQTQQLLRHKDINTTMIYVHLLERAANESERRIASAIF